MPLGNYVTFGDAEVTLQIGGDIDNTYSPIRVDAPSNNLNAFMTWQMATNNANDLRWSIAVNGIQLRTYTNNGDQFGAIQETFGGRVLNDGDNTVTVTVLSGQGQLRVSDFALHYISGALQLRSLRGQTGELSLRDSTGNAGIMMVGGTLFGSSGNEVAFISVGGGSTVQSD